MTHHPLRRRTLTRLAVVQALYQADMLQGDANRLTTTYIRDAQRLQNEPALKAIDENLFTLLFQGVRTNLSTIDAIIQGHLAKDWDINRLDTVIKAILRVAVYELQQAAGQDPSDTSVAPKGVILSEYVDITESFYEDTDEKKFVNGILSGITASLFADGAESSL